MAARALLLDLDRTLVDLQSFTDYAAALADVSALVGSWPDVAVPATDWDGPTMACMSALHSLGGDERWPEVSQAIARHERAAIPSSLIMPTVAEACLLLDEVPVAVVTLLAPDLVPEVLGQHGIRLGCEVDAVIGRSSDMRPKPEPDGLWAACQALDVDVADAVMIGDSTWDAEAARRAGIDFIGVPSSPVPLTGVEVQMATFEEAVRRALA